jgi:dolichol-phosphate mannosyltransferase
MPVYNEECTVAEVLSQVRARFGGPVVVVDDGSTDRTTELVAARDDVILVRHLRNRGYGASLRSGFTAALGMGADTVITMDCDGQHEPRHITEFCDELKHRGSDVVSGSRYLPGSGEAGLVPPDRKEVNAHLTAVINKVTGWGLTDAFCGFKAYRADGLRRVRVDEDGYAMPLEFWARAWRAGLTVCEMPVERIYMDHDRSFGQDLDDPERRTAYYMQVWERALTERDSVAATVERRVDG